MALSRDQCILIGTGAVLGIAAFVAVQRSGGVKAPRKTVTEGLFYVPNPVQPVQPAIGLGYRVTPHRYPVRVGHEFTTLIQGGHSVASVPRTRESPWIITPPSEVSL